MADRLRWTTLLADRWFWLVGPWRRQNDHDELTVSMLARLNHLENLMSSAESAAYARAAEVVGLIKAEFASLRQQVADAANAGAAALEADAQADADRINGLIDDLVTVLPVDVPEVEVPAPGAPAELPSDPAPAEPEAPADPAPADPTPADPSDETPPAA